MQSQYVRALCLLAFASFAGSTLAQVQSVTVSKGYSYVQSGPGVVALDPATNNYSFGADVDGLNISGITAPTITGPVNIASLGTSWNGGVLKYSTGDHGWRGGAGANDWGFSTKAQLDSIFPNGNYTIAVNGFSILLSLVGDAYPNVPSMTLSGGSWANGKYVVDPAQPITITTNVFTAYGTNSNDRIMLGALIPGLTLPFQQVAPYDCSWIQVCHDASGSPGSNTASFTIPANTLVAGQEYPAFAIFSRVVDRYNPALTGTKNFAGYSLSTKVILKAQAPIFPMTVNASIGATVSNATASIQPRPQDVGTTASVYTFFVAPATKVLNAALEKGAHLGIMAKGTQKDTPVQCVIAQLNGEGQLQAVPLANLLASVTGILGAQGQSVTLLNNAPTVNIAGTALYVGYGASPSSMMVGGINRRALTIPGDVQCDPQAPQTGWWWNTSEDGRGYSVEVAGSHLNFAAYLYDVTGRATWLLASGNTSLDGSFFTGNLEAYSQGQTLAGTYHGPNAPSNPGPITLAFSNASHGTMIWPGGTVAIERFNIVTDGLTLPAQQNQPEAGWWWNPAESGRGFFLEWQGGELFMAGYMYDDAGSPIWYLASNTTPSSNLLSFSASWLQLANGVTLTGAYKPASIVNNNVAPVSITFQGVENAILTLPGGRTTAIRRYRF